MKNLMLLLVLLTTHVTAQQICDMPSLPIQQRIQNRTFPSVFSAWGGIRIKNLPTFSNAEKLALHDIHWHSPYFGLNFAQTGELKGNIEEAQQRRNELLALNPNMLFIVELRIRDAWIGYYPDNFPYWLRDANGDIITSPSGRFLLTDFTQPGMQDIIVQRAIAVAQCGLFDGLFFDWFAEDFTVLQGYSYETEQQAKDVILKSIRNAVREDFIIIVNTNRRKHPRRAYGVNGSFMETLRDNDNGYTHEGLKQIEDTLIWAETHFREPQINCLEGWGIPNEPPDSPDNRRWMRVFTTMGLSLSNGYVQYNDSTGHNYWYNFWDADLGRPVGDKAQQHENINGLFIREFTNGWAVYNRSGKIQPITLPRVSTGVSSNKQDITHLLPDLDGEIYLRIGKPFDLNRDGTINILDLILISQNFGTTEGDINGDGTTDIFDLTLVARNLK